MRGIARFKDLCLDAGDAPGMARFWAAVLGLGPATDEGGPWRIGGPTPQHTVWVDPVPDPHAEKRLHLDVHCASIDELVALGAAVRRELPRWTIMTDPEFADRTYIEPITPEIVEKIIAKERPDALLPTLGGQTALNTAVALHESGVLERYGVELIGADIDAIRAGEDRDRFKAIVDKVAAEHGLNAESARSRICHTIDECLAAAEELGIEVIVIRRPRLSYGIVHHDFAGVLESLKQHAPLPTA